MAAITQEEFTGIFARLLAKALPEVSARAQGLQDAEPVYEPMRAALEGAEPERDTKAAFLHLQAEFVAAYPDGKVRFANALLAATAMAAARNVLNSNRRITEAAALEAIEAVLQATDIVGHVAGAVERCVAAPVRSASDSVH
jgi:hypothetical protein